MNGGSAGMGERIFSVDDLVGGIWRMGQATSGFHRTDSEAAFQEFLKRIPSATNLTAAATQLDPTSQLKSQNLQTTSSMPPSAEGNLPSSVGVGMQRIPSMDFLKQLSAMQQISVPQTIKLEAPTPHPGSYLLTWLELNTSSCYLL
jgi:hypothetical protein